jgi:hypothetical protein
MDELSAIQQLLAEPQPGPDVVEAARLRLEHVALGSTPLRTRAARRGWHVPALVRRAAGPRRWPGWLAPVAAAAAVVGVIIASLAISGLILRPAGTGPADSSGVFAKVPRYFVALPDPGPGRVVVGATATGAVLGTVAPPKAYPVFMWVAAAGNGRTFVLAAGVPPAPGTNILNPRPVRFYRLALGRSGHPGRLVPLPIPPETVTITGLALSPDGSKLAVALLPVRRQKEPRIQVFSLATGAGREWVWPGTGWIGRITVGLDGNGALSWEANNRTLLFEQTTRTGTAWIPQLRLLDTAAPAGSLLASSTRVPIPSAVLGPSSKNARNAPFHIPVIPLITGDGTKLVAPTFHPASPPKILGFTITEFSVRTGKPVQVLYQRRADSDADSPAVYWVNTSGTAMIAARTLPGQDSHVGRTVFGVQTPTTFTPFPPNTQRLFTHHGLFRLPAW